MNAKKSFLKMPAAKVFADIIHNPAVQTALDYAILEMGERLHFAEGDRFPQFLGAMSLRDILENLAIPDEDLKAPRTPTLNHDAYDKPARRG